MIPRSMRNYMAIIMEYMRKRGTGCAWLLRGKNQLGWPPHAQRAIANFDNPHLRRHMSNVHAVKCFKVDYISENATAVVSRRQVIIFMVFRAAKGSVLVVLHVKPLPVAPPMPRAP